MSAKKKVLKTVFFYAEDHAALIDLWESWIAAGESASEKVRSAIEQVYLSGAAAMPVLGNEHAFTAAELRAIIREELRSVRLSVRTESEGDAEVDQALDGGVWEL